MHIKFLPHGKGSASKAVDYLLRPLDAKKKIRPGIDVLRGNFSQLVLLADSQINAYRYSSGIISFHPNDKPTASQTEEVIDSFEKAAFAGLAPQQYGFGVVRHHQDDGGFHLHIFIPRVEIVLGKAFNPAPPGWQIIFDALRDHFNAKYGWKSPDIGAHPESARLASHVLRGPKNNAAAHAQMMSELLNENTLKTAIEMGVEDPKILVELEAQFLYEKGIVTNRTELIKHFEAQELYVPAVSEGSITISLDSDAKPSDHWQCKGLPFHERFTLEKDYKIKTRTETTPQKPDIEAAKVFLKKLREKSQKRARDNQKAFDISQLARRIDRDGHRELSGLGQGFPEIDTPWNGDEYSSGFSQGQRNKQITTVRLQREPKAFDFAGDSQKKYWFDEYHYMLETLFAENMEGDYSELQPFELTSLGPQIELPYRITFTSGGVLNVKAREITATNFSSSSSKVAVLAALMTSNWDVVSFTGELEQFTELAEYAYQNAIELRPESPQQKIILENIHERERIDRARTEITAILGKADRSERIVGKQVSSARRGMGTLPQPSQQFIRRLSRKREPQPSINL